MGASDNSAAAIVEQGRSKKRFALRDKIESGIKSNPNLTFKELARTIGLVYEDYCDAPKRGWDLMKLKRIVSDYSRVCSVTHRTAQVWRHVDVSSSAVGSDVASVAKDGNNQLARDVTKKMKPVGAPMPADIAKLMGSL